MIICAVKNSVNRLLTSLAAAGFCEAGREAAGEGAAGEGAAAEGALVLVLARLEKLRNPRIKAGEICIFTSPNGAEFAGEMGQIALAVGEKTAAALAKKGVRVLAASPNAHASGLLALIEREFSSERFVYLRPRVASCDICAALNARQIACRDEVVYENRYQNPAEKIYLRAAAGAAGRAGQGGGGAAGETPTPSENPLFSQKATAAGGKRDVVFSSPSLARGFYLYMADFSRKKFWPAQPAQNRAQPPTQPTERPTAQPTERPQVAAQLPQPLRFSCIKKPFRAFCIGQSTKKAAEQLFCEVYALESGCSYEEILRLREQICAQTAQTAAR